MSYRTRQLAARSRADAWADPDEYPAPAERAEHENDGDDERSADAPSLAGLAGDRIDGDDLAALDADSQFLREIRSIPLLSVDEERTLAERMRRGDESAKQRLYEANLRWIRARALKHSAGHAAWSEDYVQEAALAVWRHMDQFDPAVARFTTWAAWWVRQACQRHGPEFTEQVRRPAHAVERGRRFHRIVNQKMLDAGREADGALYAEALADLEAHEAATYAGRMRLRGKQATRAQLVTAEQRAQLVAEDVATGSHGVTVVSIEGTQAQMARRHHNAVDTPDALWIDTLAVDRPLWALGAEAVQEQARSGAMRREMAAWVATYCQQLLTEREQQVIVLRSNGYTLEQAGHALGITRERVRQLQLQAMRKLQAPGVVRRLKALRDGTAWGEHWCMDSLWPDAAAGDNGGAA